MNEFFNNIKKRDLIVAVVIFILAAILFYPVVTKMAALEHDYIAHIRRAEGLIGEFTFSPHLLYQICTIIIFYSLPVDILSAGILASLSCYGFLAVVLYFSLISNSGIPRCIVFFAVFCLMFFSQIPGLYWVDHHLYLGYIGFNTLHNPPMVVLKPLAVLMFLLSGLIFSCRNYPHKNLIIVTCAIFSILTAFSKPSYTICFVPCLTLVLAYRAYRRVPTDWSLAIFGFLAPSMALLSIQYILTYMNFISHVPRVFGEGSIIIAPLKVMQIYSSWLFPKFLLSILFPLVLVSCYRREAMRDFSLKFAWFIFGLGAFYTYFLAESGPRLTQGNFFWSGQIALFILFVVSTRLYLRILFPRCISGTSRCLWKNIFLAGVLLLHLTSGIVYYLAEHAQPERFW